MKTYIFDVVKCINRFTELADGIKSRYAITKEDCYKYSLYQEAMMMVKHDYTAELVVSVLKAENEDKQGLYDLIYNFLELDNTTVKFYRDTNDIKGNMEYAYTLAELSCYLDYLKSGEFKGPMLDISMLDVLHKVQEEYGVDRNSVFANKMQITNSDRDMKMVEALTKMNGKLLALEIVALYKLIGLNSEEPEGSDLDKTEEAGD